MAEASASYVGIMGAVKNRGVYSSPDAGIPLADLVERAGGLTDGATRMAHVIRDGRAGLRVFFTPDTSETLLPGDVVVFQGGEDGQPNLSGISRRTVADGRSGADEAASVPDTVYVAFLGLLDRQPVIVTLDGRYATVPHVVHGLRQSPAVVKTVRVIRTDRRSRPARAEGLPGRLTDGDVLVFDRGSMNADALARTQATAQTRFPAVMPMTLEPPVDSVLDDQFVAAATVFSVRVRSDSPVRVRSESQTRAADRVASAGHEPNGGVRVKGPHSIAAPDIPTGALPTVTPASSPTVSPSESPKSSPKSSPKTLDHAVVAGRAADPGGGVADLVSPFDARAGDETAARVATTDTGVTDVAETAAVPFLDLAPLVEPPKLASLVNPSDPDFEKLLGKAASTHFEPAAELPLALPLASSIPAPMDPSPTAAASDERGALAAVGTPTIVIGVLALAAMCFAVSIAWTRIDRTAQTFAEPIQANGDETASAPSRRQVLERLINNDLPMIEEPAQLPDRMDYHGEELGRRRLMLDDPHELMGPHFMAETGAEGRDVATKRNVVTNTGPSLAGGTKTGPAKAAAPGPPLSPPERARAALSRFMVAGKDSSAAADSMRRDDSVEPTGDAASDHQISGTEMKNDSESTDVDARQPAGLQPHSRLLERVLIAMERERRG